MGLFRRTSKSKRVKLASAASVATVNEEVERLNVEVSLLLQRVHTAELEQGGILELRMQMNELADRLAAFDSRITAVSTELANQITELGSELSSLDRSTDQDSTAALDELRDAQTRLASEQARYQIAFRQDLAELADRLRPR